MAMITRFTCFALVCFMLGGRPAHSLTLFADEFNDDTLNSGWQISSVQGVNFLLTKEPGHLVAQTGEGEVTSILEGNAARLALDAPDGNFTIETNVLYGFTNGEDPGSGLYITFDTKDTIAWVYRNNETLDVFNTKTNQHEVSQVFTPPFYLRIRRVANNLIFETKDSEAGQWVGRKQMQFDAIPLKVGLIFPNNEWSYTTAFGYFHLDAPGPDGPAPTLIALTPSRTPPGAIILLSGQNFRPGYSKILCDGKPAEGFFSTATQGLFQVPLNSSLGSHTLVVQTGSKVSAAVSFTVPSDQPLFASLVFGAEPGDVNGDKKIDLDDLVLVLRKAVGLE